MFDSVMTLPLVQFCVYARTLLPNALPQKVSEKPTPLPMCYLQQKSPTTGPFYLIDLIDEPSRNRTANLLIKSQLLCQLS